MSDQFAPESVIGLLRNTHQESLLDAWNHVSTKMLLVDQLRAVSSSGGNSVREGRILLADAYYEMVYAIGCQ